MQKVSSIVLYLLVAVSVVLAGLFYFGGYVTEDTGAITDDEPVFTALSLSWAYILFFGAVVITLLFSLFYIITHPKALKGTLITLLVGAALVAIAYFLASDVPVQGRSTDATITELKWVGTGLYVTYILGGLALAGIVISEIYRALS